MPIIGCKQDQPPSLAPRLQRIASETSCIWTLNRLMCLRAVFIIVTAALLQHWHLWFILENFTQHRSCKLKLLKLVSYKRSRRQTTGAGLQPQLPRLFSFYITERPLNNFFIGKKAKRTGLKFEVISAEQKLLGMTDLWTKPTGTPPGSCSIVFSSNKRKAVTKKKKK